MQVYDQVVEEVCQCVVVYCFEIGFVFVVQLGFYLFGIYGKGWVGYLVQGDYVLVIQVQGVVYVVQDIIVDYGLIVLVFGVLLDCY